MLPISITVNGKVRKAHVEPRTLLRLEMTTLANFFSEFPGCLVSALSQLLLFACCVEPVLLCPLPPRGELSLIRASVDQRAVLLIAFLVCSATASTAPGPQGSASLDRIV